MSMRMELVGVQELFKALKELPDNVQKVTVRRALVEAAQPMADAAQANAPHLTGKGARSIIVGTTLKKGAQHTGEDQSGSRAGKYEVAAYVGPTEHTRALMDAEWGTKARRQRTTYRATGTEVQRPFMRPAFDAEWRGVVLAFGPILGVQIKLAFERVYKKIRSA